MNESNATPPEKNRLRMDPDHVFQFRCAPGVPCFTQCCQDITIVLSPYDEVRLKNALGITSGDFIDRYTLIVRREKLLIPMVVLKMNEDDKRCPFVGEDGCRVYNDRPWPCRMYPLDMNDDGTFGIITNSSRCEGLKEDEHARISNWLIEQGVPVYDEMNQLFSEVTAPLKAQDLDIDNPQIYQMTFMSLYNPDKFRDFVLNSTFLERFEVDDITLEKIKRRDVDLLKFAFDWIKFGIFGQKVFSIKKSAVPEDKDASR